jgi:translocation and assembly module TamA
MRSLNLLVLVLACAAALSPVLVQAADPQPYTLALDKTGIDTLDETIAGSSQLATLREDAPAAPFALIDRARSDIARIETALNSFGYYKPHVAITVDGLDVGDPALPDRLDNVAQGSSVAIHVTIEKGELYHIGAITIDGDLPADAREALNVKTGDPAVASTILDAQQRTLTKLQDLGYAFAAVETPIAHIDDEAHTVDLTFTIRPGVKAKIGAIAINGLKEVNEDFARTALTIHSGDAYSPTAIEGARRDLVALGVFSGVSVRKADAATAGDTVPLTFDVQERPPRRVAFSVSYATDLGFNASASWTHFNLFGNAEQLVVSAAATGIGGNATEGIGYDTSVKFIKPRFLGDNQLMELDVGAIKQDYDAYKKTAQSIGAFFRRKYNDLWTGSAGITATHNEVTQQGALRLYQLIATPVTANYDDTGLTDTLMDTTHGVRASFAVTPTLALGSNNLAFAILQASGSAYFDLSGDGRSVLATRAILGSIVGGSNLDVPPDQRFYAGGSATVRGFRYQSIGPVFPDGSPVGATSLDAASIEFRQRISSDWGIAAFLDAGQAGDDMLPFSGALNAGAGAGVRYYTSIGAIRADIAVPLTHVQKTDSFQIYIGIGQAF